MSLQEEFTVEAAIAIQTDHLKEWKKLLKTKVYKNLEAWATENNHKKKTGFEVVRGTQLNNYIANYFNKYTPQN